MEGRQKICREVYRKLEHNQNPGKENSLRRQVNFFGLAVVIDFFPGIYVYIYICIHK